MKQIINDFLKGIKKIGVETMEKTAQESVKVVDTVITGKELVGDIKPMSQVEEQKQKIEDEKKKNEELDKLRAQMHGRNVEGEVKQVVDEKKKQEEEKEKMFLETVRQQREAEERERQELLGDESANPNKRKKSRGSALLPGGKKKKGMPDMQQMSQTAEVKGKID